MQNTDLGKDGAAGPWRVRETVSGIAWVPLAIVWFGVGGLTTLFYEHGVLTLGAKRGP